MKLDGRSIAKVILTEIKNDTLQLKHSGITPHLVVIFIGNDAGSKAYIKQKMKKGEEVGIKVSLKRFPTHTSTQTVISFVEKLNTDSSVHGVIIQRPLPPHFIEDEIKTAVIPEKDVDGLHPNPTFTPPLALAVMTILQEINKKEAKPSFLSRVQFLKRGKTFSHENFKKWLTSKNLVFIGRGEAGGKPIISHVEKIGIPHQVIHSKTQNREDILKTADVIITAVGKKDMVTPDMIKQGVILIGVGLHKEDGKLSGDYDEEKIRHIASFYTPTPGGVGPVNVAMLLKNVVQAAKQLH